MVFLNASESENAFIKAFLLIRWVYIMTELLLPLWYRGAKIKGSSDRNFHVLFHKWHPLRGDDPELLKPPSRPDE